MTGLADDATGPSIVAAGGWTAPSVTLYDVVTTEPDRLFPEVQALRGGIRYDRSPAELHAQVAFQEMLRRHAAACLRARDVAISAACVTAARHGWDVHVHEPVPDYWGDPDVTTHRLRFVGIEFTPGKYPGPVIHVHRNEDHTDEWPDGTL